MDLGVLEGQTSRGLFSNSIFDPSVIGANEQPQSTPVFFLPSRIWWERGKGMESHNPPLSLGRANLGGWKSDMLPAWSGHGQKIPFDNF